MSEFWEPPSLENLLDWLGRDSTPVVSKCIMWIMKGNDRQKIIEDVALGRGSKKLSAGYDELCNIEAATENLAPREAFLAEQALESWWAKASELKLSRASGASYRHFRGEFIKRREGLDFNGLEEICKAGITWSQWHTPEHRENSQTIDNINSDQKSVDGNSAESEEESSAVEDCMSRSSEDEEFAKNDVHSPHGSDTAFVGGQTPREKPPMSTLEDYQDNSEPRGIKSHQNPTQGLTKQAQHPPVQSSPRPRSVISISDDDDDIASPESNVPHAVSGGPATKSIQDESTTSETECDNQSKTTNSPRQSSPFWPSPKSTRPKSNASIRESSLYVGKQSERGRSTSAQIPSKEHVQRVSKSLRKVQKRSASDSVVGLSLSHARPPALKKFVSQGTDTEVPAFERCQENIRAPQSVAEDLFRIIEAPLSDKASAEEGFVYIYQMVDHPGHFKIGFTSKSKESRRKQISKCYQSELEEIPLAFKVSHYARVEKLIHTELQNYRRRYPCTCKQTKGDGNDDIGNSRNNWHTEWFEIDEESAKIVVSRWTDWMNTAPYSDKRLRPLEVMRVRACEKDPRLKESEVGQGDFSQLLNTFLAIPEWQLRLLAAITELNLSHRWDSICQHWKSNLMFLLGFFFCSLFLIGLSMMMPEHFNLVKLALLHTIVLGGCSVLYAA